ncbi:hypothetical protein H0H92_002871, partial [Tricholoma furcatifolium]
MASESESASASELSVTASASANADADANDAAQQVMHKVAGFVISNNSGMGAAVKRGAGQPDARTWMLMTGKSTPPLNDNGTYNVHIRDGAAQPPAGFSVTVNPAGGILFWSRGDAGLRLGIS